MNEWLSELKVGDRVVIGSGYAMERLDIVTDITRLHIVVGSSKFRRDNGIRVGETGFFRAWLAEATTDRVRALDALAKSAAKGAP